MDSLTYLGPNIWNIIPEYIKKSGSFNVFKTKIKKLDSKRLSLYNL